MIYSSILRNWIQKTGKAGPVLAAVTIMVLYTHFIMGEKSKCYVDILPPGLVILDVKVGYDVQYVQDLFTALGERGLECYYEMVTIWDNIFPLVYGWLYFSLFSLVFKNRLLHRKKILYLFLFPALAPLSDWVENFLEAQLIRHFWSQGVVDSSLVWAASLAGQIKWFLSVLVILLFLFGFTWMAVNFIQERMKIRKKQ